MPTGDIYLSNATQPNTTWATDVTVTDGGSITIECPTPYIYTDPNYGKLGTINNKKGDDDMRYLYEVILVNPKTDEFYIDRVVARSETSALMEVYNDSPFFERKNNNMKFDDLKTSCRILMEWKKEKSLKKAIETIKEAVE